jgi:hypothetical protein
MEKQQGHAYTLLKTLFFPLASGFGLWKQISSVVQQREEKCANLCFFLSQLASFDFCARFPYAPSLFSLLQARER